LHDNVNVQLNQISNKVSIFYTRPVHKLGHKRAGSNWLHSEFKISNTQVRQKQAHLILKGFTAVSPVSYVICFMC